MATHTITRVLDDLDGTPDARTIHFAFEGTDYAIDLCDANYAALVAALGPYVEAGRRQAGGRLRASNARRAVVPRGAAAPAPRRRPFVDAPEFLPATAPEPRKPVSAPPAPVPAPAPVTVPTVVPPAVIRAWWRNNGDGLPPWRAKGVVPASVVEAWHARPLNGVAGKP